VEVQSAVSMFNRRKRRESTASESLQHGPGVDEALHDETPDLQRPFKANKTYKLRAGVGG